MTKPTSRATQRWEFAVQHIGIQQRVGHRDEEEIDVHQIEEARHHAAFVDARADAADQPGLFEFRQRPEATVVQLGQISRHLRIGGVMGDVQVVDQQQIDAWQAEALQAVLEAAHHPIVAVVEAVLEFQPAAPEAVLEFLRVVDGTEQPADLGGQHIVGARTAIQRAAEAMLALPAAVPRRRVVVPDAGVPCGLQGGAGIGILDHVEQVAQPRAAEPELRELDVGAAEFAAGERVHGSSR